MRWRWTVAVLAVVLTACSQPQPPACAPCAPPLRLDLAGIVQPGEPAASRFEVCLDRECRDVAPGERMMGAHWDSTFALVTVAAYADGDLVGSASGSGLRVPPPDPDAVCACPSGILRLDHPGGALVIAPG